MQFEEARDILDGWTMLFQGKEASTNKRVEQRPNSAGNDERWWFQNSGRTPDWRTPRTVAYLTAYAEIAGPEFPASGIVLDDGYIYPDRAVIRSLLDARCLRLSGGMLRLTGRGEALIAPSLAVDEYGVRRQWDGPQRGSRGLGRAQS